jgi:hypothetical protein
MQQDIEISSARTSKEVSRTAQAAAFKANLSVVILQKGKVVEVAKDGHTIVREIAAISRKKRVINKRKFSLK